MGRIFISVARVVFSAHASAPLRKGRIVTYGSRVAFGQAMSTESISVEPIVQFAMLIADWVSNCIYLILILQFALIYV